MNDSFDTAPCGFFSFFDGGTLNEINTTACIWLGYEKDELLAKNVETIFTLPTRIFYQTHFFPLLKMQGAAEEIFVSLLAKDGQHLPVLLNAKRDRESNQPATACAFIIVANRKKFEDELVAARKQAEVALKENTALQAAQAELQRHTELLDHQIHTVEKQNNELKQLNHVVTHSLREPLRKILVHTDKLNRYPVAGETAASVALLSKASVQMRTIVSSLQQYIWLNDTPVHFTAVNFNQVIDSAKEKLLSEQPGAPLTVQAEKLPSIEGDPQQLELMFYHLLSNSLRFKKGDAANVWITGSVIQKNKFQNVANKYRYEDFIKLEVVDDGVGFDSSQAKEVFELFKKAGSSVGTGLGLALCKKIADNHSGSVAVHSKVAEGTTIRLVLPAVQTFYP